MSVPTGEDFATEVKAERLKVLSQITLVITCAAALFLTAFIVQDREHRVAYWIVAFLSLSASCWIALKFLTHDRFEAAAWSYTLGGIVMATLLMAMGDEMVLRVTPFLFPILVFLVGLMLPPSKTFSIALISSIAILFAPQLAETGASLTESNSIFAIILTFLSALLSAQMAGELYQITDWALQNYQRERRTNVELFEKRMALQKALQRSEALSDQLKDTNVELEIAHSEAEEAKHFRGQFLANMSHELRTPLNAIIGFSETILQFPMMYDDQTLPAIYENDMEQIHGSGQQLLHIINDILDLAKVDAGKLLVLQQGVDISPIIAAVQTTAKGLLGDKLVKLEQDLPDTLPTVWADDNRLRQILLNIYSNATKYTEQGEIVLKVRQVGDEAVFSVKDTGCGIAPHYLKVIFEEFSQGDTSGRDPRAGAGLGLAITQKLLELMDGRIWAESKLGEGSTFHFTIPIYSGQDKKRTEQGLPPGSPEVVVLGQTDKLNNRSGVPVVTEAVQSKKPDVAEGT